MALPGALNGKRMQVDKAQATTLGFVIGASIVTVFSLVAAKSYFSQASYLNKISSGKEKAVSQLKSNKEAVTKLQASYKSFASQNPNLIGGNSTDPQSGDNGRLVLDALPSKYDFPALATSLEKLLKGYTINNISGSDDSAAQSATTKSKPVEMPFSINVSSDYAGINKLLTTLEKSIRPIQVQKIVLSGTNKIIQADISAKTYYQPEENLKIELKVVK